MQNMQKSALPTLLMTMTALCPAGQSPSRTLPVSTQVAHPPAGRHCRAPGLPGPGLALDGGTMMGPAGRPRRGPNPIPGPWVIIVIIAVSDPAGPCQSR